MSEAVVLDASIHEVVGPPHINGLLSVVRKWFYLPDDCSLKVALAVVITSKWPGDPLWVFVVGPPSDMKTEILRSLGVENEFVYMATDASPKALVSGLSKNESGREGIDLLPKVNGKTLVIRDFTTVLSKRWEEISELFGRLRSYYDGEYNDNWGSIGNKRGKSHFNVLTAVTAAIDDYTSVQQKLGERFLKIRVDTDEEKAAECAAKFAGQEDEIRAETEAAVLEFLRSLPKVKVSIPPEVMEKITKMARALAFLRTDVRRDSHHEILDIPQPEKPPRLVKQFIKLAMGLAIVNGHDSVCNEELRIIGRIVWDTTPKIRKTILMQFPGVQALSFAELIRRTGLPKSMLSRGLADLELIGLVTENDGSYALAKKGAELLAEIWDNE